MTLPRVEPAKYGLDTEDDPTVLGQRARWLWQQWKHLGERPPDGAKGWPKSVVKAAAVQLLHQYASTEVPVPYELARLVQAMIIHPDDKATTLPVQVDNADAYWAAILFEAQKKQTRYGVAKHLLDRDLLPSKPSQDTAEGIVREWRKKSHYKANVQLYRREKD